jgi:hypothetical protein
MYTLVTYKLYDSPDDEFWAIKQAALFKKIYIFFMLNLIFIELRGSHRPEVITFIDYYWN